MADQLLAGLPPVLDFNGDVVAGGSVTFYETNTTTPVAIWSDIAATIPLANPLTLDSAGRPSNQIFYVGTVAVKEVIKDAGGATLYTVDPSPRFSVTAAAASGVTYSPIASNPSLNVQDAIDYVSTSSAVFPSIVGNAGKAPFVNGGATAVAYIDSLGYGCTATGTNTISLDTGLALNTLADGVTVGWLQAVTNTGAATVEVDNVASAPLVLNNGSAVAAGKLIAGDYYSASYDGTNWVLGAATGIDGTVIGATTPAAGTFASLTATTADINGGTIDGTVIGGTTPAAGTFTTFTSNGIDDNAASTAMTIDAAGKVGIGAPASVYRFELSDTDGNGIIFRDLTNGVVPWMGTTSGIGNGGTISNHPYSLWTNGSEKLRLTTDGNLGLGTVPNAAWGVGYTASQIENTSFFSTGDDLAIASNVYVDASNASRYISAFAFPSKYTMFNGAHYWSVSSSAQGVGNPITWDEAAMIDRAGNFGLNSTPSVSWGSQYTALQVNNSSFFSTSDDLSLASNVYVDAGNTARYNTATSYPSKYELYNGEHIFFTSSSAQGVGNPITWSEVARATRNGYFGIGTGAGASQKLHVAGALPLTIIDSTSGSGTWGLKLTSGATNLVDFTYSSVTGENRIGGTQSYIYQTFYTAGVEQARINTDGAFMVNSTAPVASSQFSVTFPGASTNGMNLLTSFASPGSAFCGFFNSAGSNIGSISQASASTTAFNTTSDYRLKENVTPIQGAGDIVKAMRPCTYTFTSDGVWSDGFIAHELQELHPLAVTGSKDAMKDEDYEVAPAVYEDVIVPAVEAVAEVPAIYDDDGVLVSEAVPAVAAEPERTDQRLVSEAVMGTRTVPAYQQIDYSKLTPILTAALQEALIKIDDLTARIDVLEAKP
jgi:hypothetical protein